MPGKYTLSFLCLLALSACSDNETSRNETPQVVKIHQVNAESATFERHFVGDIMALSTVDLSFQVGGRLQRLPISQGQILKPDTLLAELDPTDYQLAVRRAEADLAQAASDIQRKRNLYQHNAVSSAELEMSEANYENAQVQYDAARQELRYTRLKVPFTALIARRLVDNHSLVGPEMPVLRVQDVSELRVRIHVPERLIEQVLHNSSLQAYASLVSIPGQRHSLEYREHVSEADPATQSYEVEFTFADNRSVVALPGMIANVYLQWDQGNGHDGLRIPVNALTTDAAGQFFVWRYNEDNQRISRVDVEVGALDHTYALIHRGIEDGDQIVAAGAHLLREDAQVKPMQDAL